MRFHYSMGAAVALLLAFDVIAARSVHLSGFGVPLLKGFGVCLMLALFYRHCRSEGLVRMQELSVLAILSLLSGAGLLLFSQVAARTSAPLVDLSLAHLDNRMGLTVPLVTGWSRHFPEVDAFLRGSYYLLFPFAYLAIFVPTLTGHAIQARRFILSTTIGSILTSVIFAVYPAVGPWTAYGFAPTPAQSGVEAYIQHLKSAPALEMDFANSAIISFPSFHVTLAILAAAAFWPFRRLRWVSALLAVVICVSTVTTGWHYVADVLGGVAVAVASWALTRLRIPLWTTTLREAFRPLAPEAESLAGR